MPPTFQQLIPCRGVDEHIPTGGAGIIVPLGGSNTVILADGPGIRPASNTPTVQVEEITDPRTLHIWSPLLPLFVPTHKLKSGAISIWKIGSHSEGTEKREVRAKEAKLQVAVLRQTPVSVSIRPTLVRDDRGNKVSFNVAVDPQSLIDEMNSIWRPQANVVFALAKTDPAFIDGLSPESKFDINRAVTDIQANRQPPLWYTSFENNKDPAAALTMFLVRRVFDGGKPVKGTSIPGISWISDDRSDRTMAHEAGHFLLGEPGHPSTDPDDLMPEGGPGRRVPYSLATGLYAKDTLRRLRSSQQ